MELRYTKLFGAGSWDKTSWPLHTLEKMTIPYIIDGDNIYVIWGRKNENRRK